jgi:hypothetical protein
MPKHRDLERLEEVLAEVTAILAEDEAALAASRAEISGWSIAEQLDHVMKVNSSVLTRIAEKPLPLEKPINMVGRVILAIGWIPRGKGRSPKSLRGAVASRNDLISATARLRSQIDALSTELIARRDPVVPHPFFGGLTAAQALRFMVVHSEHHMKIVRDIRRK